MGDKSVKLTDRTKSLTFIFHDPTNSNASNNKAAINSYIAKLTHDRRKQAKVLQHCQHEADMHTSICCRPWKHREDACKADALGRNFGPLNFDVLPCPPVASITAVSRCRPCFGHPADAHFNARRGNVLKQHTFELPMAAYDHRTL